MEAVILCEASRIRLNVTSNTTTADDADVPTVLYAVNFLVIAVAFIFNKIGIVLLIKSKECGISNLNILFTHLSFLSIIYLGLSSIALSWKLHNMVFEGWYFVVFDVVHVAYLTGLLAMSFERVLFVSLRLRYAVVATKCVVLLFIAFVWLVALFYGFAVHRYFDNDVKLRKITSCAYNGVVVFFSFFCFVAIETTSYKPPSYQQHVPCCGMMYRPYKRRRQHTDNKVTSEFRHKYLVTFFVVLSYVFTAVVPLLIAESLHDNCGRFDVFLLTLVCLHDVNFVVLPLAYVLMQRKVLEFSTTALERTAKMLKKSLICGNYSEERERLMVKQIYEGTENLYESVECCSSDC